MTKAVNGADLSMAEAWYKDTYPENRGDGIGPMQKRAFLGALAMERARMDAILQMSYKRGLGALVAQEMEVRDGVLPVSATPEEIAVDIIDLTDNDTLSEYSKEDLVPYIEEWQEKQRVREARQLARQEPRTTTRADFTLPPFTKAMRVYLAASGSGYIYHIAEVDNLEEATAAVKALDERHQRDERNPTGPVEQRLACDDPLNAYEGCDIYIETPGNHMAYTLSGESENELSWYNDEDLRPQPDDEEPVS